MSQPFVTLLLASVLLSGSPNGGSADERDSDGDLSKALAAYFHEPDYDNRANLVAGVTEAADGSIERVVRGLETLRIWPAVEPGPTVLEVRSEGEHAVRLHVTPPPKYNPTIRYPLLILIDCTSASDPSKSNAADSQQDSNFGWYETLRKEEQFVIARVQIHRCPDFHTPPDESTDPRKWLAALRRRFHIDSERTYLYGAGRNGDAAFLLAIMYSDLFTGVIVEEGTLDLPYRPELQRILLGNLRHTPLHLIWTRPNMSPGTVLTSRQTRVAVANQSIVDYAGEHDLPITRAVLRPSSPTNPRSSPADPRSSLGGPPPLEVGDAMIGRRHFLHSIIGSPTSEDVGHPARDALTNEVQHWFRFPGHGQSGWLRAHRVADPVWVGDQIDIRTTRAADRGAFIEKVLRSKLASISGRIAGQSIEIESSRCESVELLLGPSAMDFTKPIHIRYNGKRRFSGKVTPSISTLIESTYKTWDFQRHVCVRLRIGKRGRVRPF